jgi:hypothetical protein
LTTGVTGRAQGFCAAGAALETSYGQTRGILDKYNAFLQARNLTLADNVLRTWFFVQDIDANYQGLVSARREFFAEHGLSSDQNPHVRIHLARGAALVHPWEAAERPV